MQMTRRWPELNLRTVATGRPERAAASHSFSAARPLRFRPVSSPGTIRSNIIRALCEYREWSILRLRWSAPATRLRAWFVGVQFPSRIAQMLRNNSVMRATRCRQHKLYAVSPNASRITELTFFDFSAKRRSRFLRQFEQGTSPGVIAVGSR